MRRHLGNWLRSVADRIDPFGMSVLTGTSFTYEQGKGVVFHGEWGTHRGQRSPGVPLMYVHRDRHLATTERVGQP